MILCFTLFLFHVKYFAIGPCFYMCFFMFANRLAKEDKAGCFYQVSIRVQFWTSLEIFSQQYLDGIEKSVPLDHRLSSLGKLEMPNCDPAGWISLYLHTHDNFFILFVYTLLALQESILEQQLYQNLSLWINVVISRKAL